MTDDTDTTESLRAELDQLRDRSDRMIRERDATIDRFRAENEGLRRRIEELERR